MRRAAEFVGMRLRGFGLTALVLTSPARLLEAQGSAVLRVSVRGETGMLAEASVRTGPIRVLTSADGTAVLRLAAGLYQVHVARIGFVPDTVAVSLAANSDTTITVALRAETPELEEITVSSTRSNRRIEEQPVRVEVLGREEIEEKLLMTPGDISMLLNETGGLRVQTTSPSLGGANVRVQGLRGRYTLILADGLPLYGGQAGGLGLLQVPPMDLGQVEVVKGAASALYGSSALGGVINLISRRPTGEREALINGTTLGGVDGVLWVSGKLDTTWGYSILAGGHRQGRVDRDDDGWTDVPGYERAVVRPRLYWVDGAGQSAIVTAGLTQEGRRGGTVAGATAPDGSVFAEDLTTTRLDVGAVARFSIGSGLQLAARASGMTQRHRHQFGDIREPDRHGTWFSEFAMSRATPTNVWVLGLALQGERYRSSAFPAFDYTFTTPSVFAHDELQVLERLSMAGSARLDVHSEYGTFLSPRVSALVGLGGTWTARASAGTGFFAPIPFTEETEVTGLSRLLPLTGLEAERARSAALDVGGTLGPLELNVTLFGSLVDHAVQLRPSPSDAARFELVNAGEVTRTYGGELLARFRREPFAITGTYVYTRSTEPTLDASARRIVPLTPRHSAGLVGTFEQERALRVGVEMYYTGNQVLDDNPYRSASQPYLIFGALVERHIGRGRVFLNFENITDVRQTKYEPLVLPFRADDGRWTTDAWAPLEGRVINGGVRLSF